jgi:hypothetical protein
VQDEGVQRYQPSHAGRHHPRHVRG